MSADAHDKDLQKRIQQLEAELQIARQQLAEQHQKLAIQQQRCCCSTTGVFSGVWSRTASTARR